MAISWYDYILYTLTIIIFNIICQSCYENSKFIYGQTNGFLWGLKSKLSKTDIDNLYWGSNEPYSQTDRYIHI